MVAEDIRQLLDREFRDCWAKFAECRIVGCKHGEIRRGVDSLRQTRRLQRGCKVRQSSKSGGGINTSWDCQNFVDNVYQATVEFNILNR